MGEREIKSRRTKLGVVMFDLSTFELNRFLIVAQPNSEGIITVTDV